MSEKTEELQAELDSLKSELGKLTARISEIEATQISLKTEHQNTVCRIEALTGINRWRGKSQGLIDELESKLLESKSPIYSDKFGVTRIISVDKKWIELKRDGNSLAECTKYSRETGWRMRSRSDYDAIDAQKALNIWNEHCGNN